MPNKILKKNPKRKELFLQLHNPCSKHYRPLAINKQEERNSNKKLFMMRLIDSLLAKNLVLEMVKVLLYLKEKWQSLVETDILWLSMTSISLTWKKELKVLNFIKILDLAYLKCIDHTHQLNWRIYNSWAFGPSIITFLLKTSSNSSLLSLPKLHYKALLWNNYKGKMISVLAFFLVLRELAFHDEASLE